MQITKILLCRSLLFISLLTLLLGCDVDGSPTEDAGPKKEEPKPGTIKDVLEAEQARVHRCNSNDAINIIVEGEAEGQDDDAYYEAREQGYNDAIAAGDTKLNPDDAKECADSLNNTPCGDRISEACSSFLEGLRPVGSECDDSFTCDATGYCVSEVGQCGECVPVLQLDEDCEVDPFVPCVDGTACVYDDNFDASCQTEGGDGDPCPCESGLECSYATETCVPLGGLGDDCAAIGCKEGIACRVSDDGYTCQERGSTGDFCEYDLDCADELPCIGLYLTSVCKQPEAGDECDPNAFDGCGYPDKTGFFCVPESANADVGSCGQITANALGQDCDDQLTYCSEGFSDNYCNSGTCEVRPGIGDECPSFECIDGAICNSSQSPYVCIATPQEGEPCPTFQCEPGFVCASDPANNDENRCLPYNPNGVCEEP